MPGIGQQFDQYIEHVENERREATAEREKNVVLLSDIQTQTKEKEELLNHQSCLSIVFTGKNPVKLRGVVVAWHEHLLRERVVLVRTGKNVILQTWTEWSKQNNIVTQFCCHKNLLPGLKACRQDLAKNHSYRQAVLFLLRASGVIDLDSKTNFKNLYEYMETSTDFNEHEFVHYMEHKEYEDES